jgi:hypothetical protein
MENQMTDLQIMQMAAYFNVLIIVLLSIFYVLNTVKDYNFIYNTTLRQKRLDMLKKLGFEDLTISSPIVNRGLKLRAFE